MAIFKCKMCGGDLDIKDGASVCECEYCGTMQTLPKIDDEQRANLYDRANHFRRNNEYDKAMSIYERILNEDKTDAEAYWSLVLCKYGIEYVEDPASHKRVPTVNRAQYTSIFADEDYKQAIANADGYQKDIYEAEAKAIDEIQKGILEISNKEEPFDVFICYKETGNDGRRTPDSVLATELYHELTREGFKVFFSRITLEDKLGTAYEPYIFAALNSSKVMVVLGTKPEYFNAVWVKNEWSRYLALIKNGERKVLIPAYKDMDPYDLPEEFSHLQAQDMSKLGFMSDLVRGIRKLVDLAVPKQEARETVVAQNNSDVAPLLERMFMFLEDAEWDRADSFAEQVLNIEPKCAEAYIGKLMAQLYVKTRYDLKNCKEPFNDNNNYQKAIRFGNTDLKTELNGYIDYINIRNENERINGIYNEANAIVNTAKYVDELETAIGLFSSIIDFKDSKEKIEHCKSKIQRTLEKAEQDKNEKIYNEALELEKPYSSLDTWGKKTRINEAIEKYKSIINYKDSAERITACERKIEEIKVQEEQERLERERKAKEDKIAAEKAKKKKKKIIIIATVIVLIVIAVLIIVFNVVIPSSNYNKALNYLEKEDYEKACNILVAYYDYKDCEKLIVEPASILAEKYYDEGDFLKAKYYYNLSGDIDSEKSQSINVDNFISNGDNYIIGLNSNSKVIAKGDNLFGQCNVENWSNIVSISAGRQHSVGLKSNGTVIAAGDKNSYYYTGECNVEDWNDIIAISAGSSHTIGLKKDGTVVATNYISNKDANLYCGQCNVQNWNNIVQISAGGLHTVGLKKDGTVIAVGSNECKQCDVSGWTDIVAISSKYYHTVGLKKDGTVVATGNNDNGECDVNDWCDIVAISAGYDYTIGLKRDGTLLSTGRNHNGKINMVDVVAISAGEKYVIGIKKDGSIVTEGFATPEWNYYTNDKDKK